MKKKCNTCGVEKSLTEYWKTKQNLDGRVGTCKECHKERKKLYYQKNKDKISQKAAERYRKNPCTARERANKWHKENPEKVRKRNKVWYASLTPEEKEKNREKVRKYRKTEKGKAYEKSRRSGPKYKARYRANNAIRDGRMQRGDTCMICTSKDRIEMHHPDYSKPLEVVWLCKKCHTGIHNAHKE